MCQKQNWYISDGPTSKESVVIKSQRWWEMTLRRQPRWLISHFALLLYLWSWNQWGALQKCWLTSKVETAMHMLHTQSIFQKETQSLLTWKYIDSSLVKSCGIHVDMQILSLLGYWYKHGKGSVWDLRFVSLVFEISESTWDKLIGGCTLCLWMSHWS